MVAEGGEDLLCLRKEVGGQGGWPKLVAEVVGR